MPFAKYPPMALREVERHTRNPEKLANAGGRCWKDSLGRNKSFRTYHPPYPPRRRLVTETKKLLQEEIWMDNVRKDLKEKSGKLPGLVKLQKTKRSLEESYGSLIVGIADGGEKRREEDTS